MADDITKRPLDADGKPVLRPHEWYTPDGQIVAAWDNIALLTRLHSGEKYDAPQHSEFVPLAIRAEAAASYTRASPTAVRDEIGTVHVFLDERELAQFSLLALMDFSQRTLQLSADQVVHMRDCTGAVVEVSLGLPGDGAPHNQTTAQTADGVGIGVAEVPPFGAAENPPLIVGPDAPVPVDHGGGLSSMELDVLDYRPPQTTLHPGRQWYGVEWTALVGGVQLPGPVVGTSLRFDVEHKGNRVNEVVLNFFTLLKRPASAEEVEAARQVHARRPRRDIGSWLG